MFDFDFRDIIKTICIVIILLATTAGIVWFIYLGVTCFVEHTYKNSDNSDKSIEIFSTDTESTEWTGPQSISVKTEYDEYVSIPGFDMLVLDAFTKKQKVNIYNPKENSAYIIFSLYKEDELIWQSGYCKPGDGYYEIELEKELPVGLYSGRLLNECFDMHGNKLNSAEIKIRLVVQ